MKQYLELLDKILSEGNEKGDRTGTGVKSLFGHQMRFDLSAGFPLVTTKKVSFRAIASELIWFLSGSTNINDLDSSIWNQWADKNGSIGPMYSKQWRAWNNGAGCGIDQISNVIESIKNNPNSRRHIVSAWNVADLPDESLSPQENVENGKMALAPCHALFQFYVVDGKLSCQLYQRSADLLLGLPYNIASYALLTHMIAKQCGLDVGEFILSLGDAHLYSNHEKQARLQLSRLPYPLPTLVINRSVGSIFDYVANDFSLVNYYHHDAISAPIAV